MLTLSWKINKIMFPLFPRVPGLPRTTNKTTHRSPNLPCMQNKCRPVRFMLYEKTKVNKKHNSNISSKAEFKDLQKKKNTFLPLTNMLFAKKNIQKITVQKRNKVQSYLELYLN